MQGVRLPQATLCSDCGHGPAPFSLSLWAWYPPLASLRPWSDGVTGGEQNEMM